MDTDDPSLQLAALQNNLRVKVQAMAAQGMWDASEADGSTYLGGSAARRRQPARAAAAADGGSGSAQRLDTEHGPQQQQQQHQQHLAPPPQLLQQMPPPPPLGSPPQLKTPPIQPPPADDSGKTLLHLSPGKRGQLVHVAGSPPPPPLSGAPVGEVPRQQIIVIQQEGEEEIDLSRVLGSVAPSDAQTLTMNADGLLVDDQGNPVSLMVEGGGTATHLLEYLRGSEPPVSAAAAAVRPPPA